MPKGAGAAVPYDFALRCPQVYFGNCALSLMRKRISGYTDCSNVLPKRDYRIANQSVVSRLSVVCNVRAPYSGY